MLKKLKLPAIIFIFVAQSQVIDATASQVKQASRSRGFNTDTKATSMNVLHFSLKKVIKLLLSTSLTFDFLLHYIFMSNIR